MKFPHKKAKVNEDKLYEEKTFDRDYEEDQKRYRKRMKEIEKSRRSSLDMMEEAENDEYFELENVIGPGYDFNFDDKKVGLKEKVNETLNKLSLKRHNKSHNEKIKLDKKDNMFIIGFTAFKGLSYSGISTLAFTDLISDGISTESNIIFGVTSFLLIAGIYPITRVLYIKDKKNSFLMKKIDCTNEVLDLNGLYYDAGDEELDINIVKVK